MDVRVAATADDAAQYSAMVIADWLLGAVERRGRASVAFSGGSTPAAMLRVLGTLDVPWSAVHVFQVDERVVADGDPRRNAPLLDALPVDDAHRHLMPVTTPLETAVVAYGDGLPDRFDVVHLGLGDDGHTASWPPGDPVVDAATDVALSNEYQGTIRMTLTPRPVNRARRRLVLATGDGKAEPIARWLLEDTSLPVARLRRADTIVVIDQAAAAQLPTNS